MTTAGPRFAIPRANRLEVIFESLVGNEEGHFDAFDKQLGNIKRFGPSYLAMQSFEGGPTESDQAK